MSRSPKGLLKNIVRCCIDSTEPELRNEAAGVLLSITELAIEEQGDMLRSILHGPSSKNNDAASGNDPSTSARVSVVSALQLLSESFDSSMSAALKARAAQAVREIGSDAGGKK